MKTTIVLAMHGIPPKEYPREEIVELFSLHQRLHSADEKEKMLLRKQHEEIEGRMRQGRARKKTIPSMRLRRRLPANSRTP